jgi:hypothetical protein
LWSTVGAATFRKTKSTSMRRHSIATATMSRRIEAGEGLSEGKRQEMPNEIRSRAEISGG